jgi:hypothetical protein
MDFIIVLHDTKAVKTFCSRMHFSLGAGCSVAAGPVGRVVEADLRAGDKGSGMCYTYSCSKGSIMKSIFCLHEIQRTFFNLSSFKCISIFGLLFIILLSKPWFSN